MYGWNPEFTASVTVPVQSAFCSWLLIVLADAMENCSVALVGAKVIVDVGVSVRQLIVLEVVEGVNTL